MKQANRLSYKLITNQPDAEEQQRLIAKKEKELNDLIERLKTAGFVRAAKEFTNEVSKSKQLFDAADGNLGAIRLYCKKLAEIEDKLRWDVKLDIIRPQKQIEQIKQYIQKLSEAGLEEDAKQIGIYLEKKTTSSSGKIEPGRVNSLLEFAKSMYIRKVQRSDITLNTGPKEHEPSKLILNQETKAAKYKRSTLNPDIIYLYINNDEVEQGGNPAIVYKTDATDIYDPILQAQLRKHYGAYGEQIGLLKGSKFISWVIKGGSIEMQQLRSLTRLATDLDNKGMFSQADVIDTAIKVADLPPDAEGAEDYLGTYEQDKTLEEKILLDFDEVLKRHLDSICDIDQQEFENFSEALFDIPFEQKLKVLINMYFGDRSKP